MELLVHVGEQVGPTRQRAGDVIVIQNDGWPWGNQERAHPDWRFIRAPILPTLAAVLTQHANDAFRLWTLDLSRLGRLEHGTINERTRDEVTRAVVQR